jgi:hypothetical protein
MGGYGAIAHVSDDAGVSTYREDLMDGARSTYSSPHLLLWDESNTDSTRGESRSLVE